MTAPAPHGATPTDPEVLLGYQGDVSGLHPDVLAYARTLVGPVTAYRLKWLQRQYDRGLLRRAEREDDGPAIWRTVGNRSTPADPQGDRIARKLSAA